MKGRARTCTLLVVILLLLVVSGCPASRYAAPVLETQAPTPPTLLLSAVPTYRLLIYPDLPSASRLFVVRTRVEPMSEDLFHFTPADVRVTLADGTTGRAFDRARAKALLDALELAETRPPANAPPSGDYWDGRLSPAIAARVREEISLSLLDEGAFTRSQPIEGYLVVDSVRLLSSLNDAELVVSVSRVGDDIVSRQTYAFNRQGEAHEAAPDTGTAIAPATAEPPVAEPATAPVDNGTVPVSPPPVATFDTAAAPETPTPVYYDAAPLTPGVAGYAVTPATPAAVGYDTVPATPAPAEYEVPPTAESYDAAPATPAPAYYDRTPVAPEPTPTEDYDYRYFYVTPTPILRQ